MKFPLNRLIDSRKTDSSSTVKPIFAKKTKKTLFYKLITGWASLAIFAVPLLAQAGGLSFFGSLFNHTAVITSAVSAPLNSQTMPVLMAAVNIDPNPPTGGGDITVVDGSALVASEGPSGTAADVSTRPAASQISVYIVRVGDSLGGIAKMFGVSVNTIVWANEIKGGSITPGQTLIILPITGIQHTVLKGETLAGLAKSFKSDAHDIAQYNDLADDATLTVGDAIIIPNGEQAAPKAPTPTWKQLAKQGKPTAKLHDAGGADQGNYYSWPVVGGIITQGLHGFNGVDIGAPRGTTIFAAAAGEVIIAKSGGWNGGYGSYVVIAHGNGTQTLYAHASKVLVSVGDSVAAGQPVALIGATGEATGPHLHFEVRGAKNPFGDLGLGGSE